MRHAGWWVVLAPALAIAGCTHAARLAPDSSPTDAAAIRGLTDTYLAAWNAGNVAALAGMLAEDAIVVPPDGPPARGREAYRRAATEYFNRFTATQSATTDDVNVHGDLAVAEGTWSIRETPRTGGAGQTRSGQWLAVAKRQADGSWQPWRWIYNQASGAAALAAAAEEAGAAGSAGAQPAGAQPAGAEAEINQLLAAYAAAINARDQARVRELYPSISAAGLRDLMRIGSTDVVKIVPATGSVRTSGTGNAMEILLNAEIVPLSQNGETRRMIYTVARGPRGWYIVSARPTQE